MTDFLLGLAAGAIGTAITISVAYLGLRGLLEAADTDDPPARIGHGDIDTEWRELAAQEGQA